MWNGKHHLKDYTISRLAKDANVSVNVIRNYEQSGILKPVRITACNYKVYDKHALERLRFVQAGKAAGLSLSDITKFFQTVDADKPNSQNLQNELLRLKSLIENKQAKLSQFRQFLEKFKK